MSLIIQNIHECNKINFEHMTKAFALINDFHEQYTISNFHTVVQIVHSDSDDENVTRSFPYNNRFSYIIQKNDNIVGFFSNDEKNTKNIMLSPNIDWINAIATIIKYCQRDKYMTIEIDTNVSIIQNICEKYFNGVLQNNDKYDEHNVTIYIPCINYNMIDYSNNVYMKSSPSEFKKGDPNFMDEMIFESSCTVINFNEKDKYCDCMHNKYIALFKKPVMWKHPNASDTRINLEVTHDNKIIKITNEYMDEMKIDHYNGLRLNKIRRFDDDFFLGELLYGFEIFNWKDIKQLEKNKDEYRIELCEKMCEECKSKYGTRYYFVRSDNRLMSDLFFNKLKITPIKINREKLFTVSYKIKDIFIPQMIMTCNKTDIIVDKSDNIVAEYCYINHERESIRMKEEIYKIGKTKQEGNKRLNQYPKNTIQKIKMQVSNCTECEKEIKRVFNKMFINRKDFGTEYYEGNYDEMQREFIKIAQSFSVA